MADINLRKTWWLQASSPEMYPFTGGYFSVTTGEKYTLKVKGYSETNNAHLYINGNTGNLIWPRNTLHVGPQNEGCVSNDVTIPTGVTQIWAGVLFANPAIGNTFEINEVALFKHKGDDYVLASKSATKRMNTIDLLTTTQPRLIIRGSIHEPEAVRTVLRPQPSSATR